VGNADYERTHFLFHFGISRAVCRATCTSRIGRDISRKMRGIRHLGNDLAVIRMIELINYSPR
jgi:hypothetical protein